MKFWLQAGGGGPAGSYGQDRPPDAFEFRGVASSPAVQRRDLRRAESGARSEEASKHGCFKAAARLEAGKARSPNAPAAA
jgi:hypothetical protein